MDLEQLFHYQVLECIIISLRDRAGDDHFLTEEQFVTEYRRCEGLLSSQVTNPPKNPYVTT